MFKWLAFFTVAFIFFVWCKIGFPDFIVKAFLYLASVFIITFIGCIVVDKIKKNR